MAIEGRSDASKGGRMRLGMVGCGEGAFIGAVHRIASRIDDQYELVPGALSSTPEKSRRSGEALGLAHDRIYDDYESMAKAEAKRPDTASQPTGAAARRDGTTRWPSWWSCKATIRRGSMRCPRALPTARRRTRCERSATSTCRSFKGSSRRVASGGIET